MHIHYIGLVFMLLAAQANAAALELRLDHVMRDLGSEVVEITVIEPHCSGSNCKITYVGIPFRKLIEFYYSDAWKSFQGELHLFARDGYLEIVDADKIRKQDGYLTFARADGEPFIIDNHLQNERNVPLGPFYLVWDNVKHAELQKEGAYGWPYQVKQIQLMQMSVYQDLVPADASPAVRNGFKAYKTYCLSCHHIKGVGGKKVATDMRELVSGKSRDELHALISDPRSVRPETKMPPLNTNLCKDERARIVDQIIDFLME